MTDPEPSCPGCGQPPKFQLGDQAFCGNDGCHVLMWNPTMTLDQLAADVQLIDPPDLGRPCPRCGAVSHHPTDQAQGYCGRCHDWTMNP